MWSITPNEESRVNNNQIFEQNFRHEFVRCWSVLVSQQHPADGDRQQAETSFPQKQDNSQ
ncbi:hypothetical protein [Calycomorphotria hydatis]|uniref:hypothetical protein n=1 Tax=Calycomorphotria hydatis TaxID=2528027 RepID=UPI0018D200CA|nr:hypothetical protein [Calycomorphotria hydatis]